LDSVHAAQRTAAGSCVLRKATEVVVSVGCFQPIIGAIGGLPTFPQAQEQQQEDRFKGILAA